MTLLKDGPLRFLTINMLCPECFRGWNARVGLYRRAEGLLYEHLTGEHCECGVEGKPTDQGIDALSLSIDSIEGEA